MLDVSLAFENDGLFRTDIGGCRFLYRLLTLKEYRVLNSIRSSGMLTEWGIALEALNRCLLTDHRLLNQNLPVGIYVSVGQLILYLSGDCEQDTLKTDIQVAREFYPALSVQERMKHTIFVAFPSYTIDDADSWTRPELIRKFVIAEHALISRQTGYQPLDVEEIKPYHELLAKAEPVKQAEDISKIDFAADAMQVQKNSNFWETQDLLEEQVVQETKRLTTAQARKLDKISKPGR
jgi:hypothetical protein